MEGVDFKEKPALQSDMEMLSVAIDDSVDNQNKLMAWGGCDGEKGLVQMWDYSTGKLLCKFVVE